MTYKVRDALPQDLLWFSQNMRKCDRDEIAAAGGHTPSAAMMYAHGYVKTALVDNLPLLIFGVAPSPTPEAGLVWMLASDYLEAPRPRRLLARHSREWVEDMQQNYDLLFNIADARNTAHHKWLKFCGFKFIRKFNHGPCNAPFYEFARMNNV